MKTTSKLILLSIFLFLVATVYAQEIVPGQQGMWPVAIKYYENLPVFKQGSIPFIDSKGEKVAVSDVKLISKEEGASGMMHYRYQQMFKGIPVENAFVVVHSKANKISSQNGKFIKDFPVNLNAKSTLKESDALNKALLFINANEYKWQNYDEEQFLKREQQNPDATFYPVAELVFYGGEVDLIPSGLKLAYKFDIYANDPLSRKYVFVDAANGSILGSRELIHETNAVGTAVTAYSGTQTITTDYTGANYVLREVARGVGNGVINTYNLQQGTNYGAAIDFTDADNNWNNVNANKDEYATDAHWATEKTYDYFYLEHNRNSIDNAGFPLNSYVHYNVNYFNAFWDGNRMTYGDGSATNGFKPLTSLDVCGHEVTHGLTQRTSNLVYAYESGAMNEGFSDIFGTAIEWYARPASADWLIGGDFYVIRSMSNPNAYSHPDTYHGTHWYTGSGDNGGVHYNSGVLNYWFYLLVNGGSGINDHGVAFSVSGLGLTNAAKIAFLLNTSYLISTSGYSDARALSLLAAEEIFGPGNEVTQTGNAWNAVGLYAPTCAPVLNLATTSTTEYSASVSWDAMPGAIYYIVEYKLSTASVWTYSSFTTGTSAVINSLNSSTLYDWRVKSSCSSVYSQAQFTTASPACNAPTGMGVVVVGTTANLEWDNMAYAVSYHLQYKPQTDSVWIDSGWVAGTSYILTGLNNNTIYDWRLETNCSFDSSDWVASTFLTDAPSCGTPTGLNVSYAAGLTTILTWNEVPGALNYRVQLKWPFANWGFENMDSLVTNDSMVIVGFMSGMNLDWRVRAQCSDNLSFYTQSTLTTPCPEPSGLTVSAITSNSVLLNWVASGANTLNGYGIYYKLATASTYTYYGATYGTSITLSGLAQGKLYDVRVRQFCHNTNSVYVQTQFTTLCSVVPSLVTATEVKTTGAKITWTAVSGTVSYTLQYRKSPATTWTTISGITSNFYTLTGLTASSLYNVQVNAICTYGSTAYSPITSFNTYCSTSGNNSQEWIDQFSLGTINRVSGADAGGYIHTGLSTNLVIGSAGNAGFISAGFSSSTRTERYAIYIDFNRNGSYADVGELVAGPVTFSTTGNVSFSISIPAGLTPGNTSMRVKMIRNGAGTMAPCLTSVRGETEDYFVNLTAPAAFAVRSEGSTSLNVSAPQALYSASPNPSEGIFRIESINTIPVNYYEVVNISGAVIAKKYVSSDELLVIDITKEAAGIYFLRINDANDNNQILKLVKK
jgi:bacillolysin